MLCLGMALFTTEPLLTNPVTQTYGYVTAAILAASCLVAACIRVVLLARYSSRRQIGVYVLSGEVLLTAWLFLWVARSEPLDLRVLDILAGCHAVFWGLWLVKLALQLRKHSVSAALLSIFAAITSAAGLVIATQPSLTRITAVTLVSCYLLYVGIFILSIDLLLFRFLDPNQTRPDASGLQTVRHQEVSSAEFAPALPHASLTQSTH